ncbi:MAG: hypothetical protein GF309_11540 [Candidatus Lokiarchaeota archaeon]|nr:hypothetical protein [Candidatus Lokiarchaeota archaeon]
MSEERSPWDPCYFLVIPLTIMLIIGVSYVIYESTRPYYYIESNHTVWKVTDSEADTVLWNGSRYWTGEQPRIYSTTFPVDSSDRIIALNVTVIQGSLDITIYPSLGHFDRRSFDTVAEWRNITHLVSSVDITASSPVIALTGRENSTEIEALIIGYCVVEET